MAATRSRRSPARSLGARPRLRVRCRALPISASPTAAPRPAPRRRTVRQTPATGAHSARVGGTASMPGSCRNKAPPSAASCSRMAPSRRGTAPTAPAPPASANNAANSSCCPTSPSSGPRPIASVLDCGCEHSELPLLRLPERRRSCLRVSSAAAQADKNVRAPILPRPTPHQPCGDRAPNSSSLRPTDPLQAGDLHSPEVDALRTNPGDDPHASRVGVEAAMP